MAKFNWQKVNDQKAIDYARRNNPAWRPTKKSYKLKKITNSQKKLIAKLLRERDIKWSNEINSLSLREASQFIQEIKQTKTS